LSEIRTDTISAANGTGPVTLTGQSAAKAWANVNHSTPVINQSFNVSSFSDLATGNGKITYSSALSSSNNVMDAGGKTNNNNNESAANRTFVRVYSLGADSGSHLCADENTTARDLIVLCYATHGDLA